MYFWWRQITEETHTLSSIGTSFNQALNSNLFAAQATSLNPTSIYFSDENISMTSNSKITGIANARELLKTFQAIKNDLSTMEVRDSATKKTYPIQPFLKMCYCYIPKKDEMKGKGLRKSHWKIVHFLTTADYFIDEAGFPSGKLPNHKEWCQHRGDAFTVYVNVFGEVLYVDDPDVEGMYDGLVNFPVKLYNEMNRQFALALQKHFATPLAIDDAEPFGALMAFQRHVIWRLVKQCIDAHNQIGRALSALEIIPLRSRLDVSNMEAGASVLLSFKEMSACRPKSSYDKFFFDNVLSSLEGQEGFSKEVDRVRAVRNIHRLRDAMEKGDVSRVTFFDRLTEIFSPDIE